jgi:lipopolysaccharide heptosyltransferase II
MIPGMKILVIRPDRIGDVVLSTPVLEALKLRYPNAEIHFLVRDTVVPVVEHNPFIKKLVVYRTTKGSGRFSESLRLAKEIRAEHFDVAVTLQVNFWVSLAQFLARVPRRTGPYSKWYSYLFFNRGQRQRRSEVAMHEAEYNLALLKDLDACPAPKSLAPRVVADKAAQKRAEKLLHSVGLSGVRKIAVVHPGMAGSALNWPEVNYASLVRRLAEHGIPVLVSGAKPEQELVSRIIESAQMGRLKLPIHSFIGEVSPEGLADLIGLLSFAGVMVAPSTGPLHLASALGKPTVSFYSPIKVQSAARWAPYTKSGSEGLHAVWVPEVECGQEFKCAGERCPAFYCMAKVSVDEAFESVLKKLELENRS